MAKVLKKHKETRIDADGYAEIVASLECDLTQDDNGEVTEFIRLPDGFKRTYLFLGNQGAVAFQKWVDQEMPRNIPFGYQSDQPVIVGA